MKIKWTKNQVVVTVKFWDIREIFRSNLFRIAFSHDWFLWFTRVFRRISWCCFQTGLHFPNPFLLTIKLRPIQCYLASDIETESNNQPVYQSNTYLGQHNHSHRLWWLSVLSPCPCRYETYWRIWEVFSWFLWWDEPTHICVCLSVCMEPRSLVDLLTMPWDDTNEVMVLWKWWGK